MVFSLLRRLAGLEKPSQDNAEYIKPTISICPSLITSETTLVGITINSTLGTKCGVPNFAPFLLRALTDTDRVRGAIRINLFGDNAKFLEKMLSEHHCDRNIASVASTSDQDAANAAAVMPRIEGMPVSAQIGFEPGAEIHWIEIGGDANITQIARGVARGDIHAAA